MYFIQVQHEGILFSCDRCEFKAKKKIYLKRHMKIQHADGVFYCGQCAYQTDTQFNLKQHVETVHGGICYSCDRCNYKGIAYSNLQNSPYSVKRDPNYAHTVKATYSSPDAKIQDGVMYACDHCEYKSNRKFNLKQHVESTHEGKYGGIFYTAKGLMSTVGFLGGLT